MVGVLCVVRVYMGYFSLTLPIFGIKFLSEVRFLSTFYCPNGNLPY